MSKFLEIFKQRGFFHQCTDEVALGELGNITAYIGFDCTADSLHVGSLMQIMVLRLLKQTGNKPIILLGGATTKVGDPSGKDESRPVITEAEIQRNKQGIKKVFDKFGLGDCLFVDNSEWLDNISYLEFLSKYGKLISVNNMIAKDSVKQRLERQAHLSFLEFNYMIFQAYDFVELNRKYNCNTQIGGSDQWGNITAGIELGRKLGSDKNLFGLTTPLITTSSGAKMGKTADGAIWLDAEKLSPYDYYQFWRNTEDADVIRFLKFFTELPIEKIAELEKLQGQEINEAKKILAYEATKLCHGEPAAEAAQDAAITAFEQGGTEGLPEVEIAETELPAFALFKEAGLAESGGEARRLIKGGGAKIDDAKVEDENQVIKLNDGMKLSSGKKKHIIVRLK
ncbi:MAG: tyrosine--tRNA ligase [Alphaproteobacteria bacterium CG11_big_fil_rev_8_21_14_0_20_44_7]|nr:MAG: tyrosine--tRNA ligase [Alphaproteobacteria bacterium CG11_big_fil_rev_8_21_14_0_20_44_7]